MIIKFITTSGTVVTLGKFNPSDNRKNLRFYVRKSPNLWIEV